MKKEMGSQKITWKRLKKTCSVVCALSIMTGSVMGGLLTNSAWAQETGATSPEAATVAPQETANETSQEGSNAAQGNQPAIELTAKAAVLMEASTGTIIYENNADQQLCPASITKIMTLILIFDALKEGKISLEDMVTTSEHAASMGGSQVFLEAQEQQKVETMIKCIAVASANDACVAYRDSRRLNA